MNDLEYNFSLSGERRLSLRGGDITRLRADAIVNAANSGLRGGGGVDGAIHRVGGPSLMSELDQIRRASGGCPTGSAVVTGAGKLPARYVLHAVGPVYQGGSRGEAAQLASCYATCLRLAGERGLGTLSFPSISTGAYGYPVEEAAGIALDAVLENWAPESSLREVIFVLYDPATFEAYRRALAERQDKRIQ